MKDARKAELDALAADLEPVQTELDASNAAYQGALAEGRLLREALLEWKFITQSMAGPDLIDAMEQGYEALNATPIVAAEVERVRRLEKVAEAAHWAIGGCIYRDDPDREELACDVCQWREVCAALTDAELEEGEG